MILTWCLQQCGQCVRRVMSKSKFLNLCMWQFVQLHVCNCITASVPVYGLIQYVQAHACGHLQFHVCLVLVYSQGEHSSASDLLLLSSFHPSLSLLLFSSSSPPPPPLLILLRAAIHNKDHSGRKGVCWEGGKHPILSSFALLPFGLKSASIKRCRMIYGMKLACCLNGFSVIQSVHSKISITEKWKVKINS